MKIIAPTGNAYATLPELLASGLTLVASIEHVLVGGHDISFQRARRTVIERQRAARKAKVKS